jgi:hypothetical protein
MTQRAAALCFPVSNTRSHPRAPARRAPRACPSSRLSLLPPLPPLPPVACSSARHRANRAQRIGPSGERTITFDAIAAASNLPVDQVELLIMRALSLKLIRGLLDQVDGTLRVTWVQPRVLQTAQIALMKERLQTWTGTVNKTLLFLENETPEFSS